jgi:hypothetical protein
VDFIERWFGFSPDLEALLLVALVTIVTGIALGFFRKQDVPKR